MRELAYGITSATIICVRLFGSLEVSRRGPDGNWQVVKKEEWTQGTPPRTVLKRLLTAPGRHLSRVDLEDDLWPDAGAELADRHLSNALMVLRRILGKDLVETSGPLCGLADFSQVWTDLDACSALLREAENHGCTTTEALPFLEEIQHYLERGACLEGESEIWCHAVRTDAERMGRQCRAWLAEGYELAGKFWQAGEIYRAMTRAFPPDEEALQHWMQMLARHGKTMEALQCYQDTKAAWDAQEFVLSPVLTAFATHLQERATRVSLSPTQPLQDILLLKQHLGEQGMNYSRRHMLQGILAAACTTLTLSPYTFLQPEQQERLLVSIQSSFHLNEAVLDDFSEITRRYWKLSANASLQLLNGLFGLFQDIAQILGAPQPLALSERLYSLSSEVAQLLGKTLFDLRDYPLALSYYSFALKAALEAHNDDLWATSLGRMGLLLLANDQPQQTLALLAEAKGVRIQSQKIGPWHAAIEAEAYSYLGNSSSCRKALERAKDASDAAFLEADTYAIGFTRARLASYEGSCYLRLNQPENALPVLEQAMKLIEPTAVRRLSRLLAYLGEAHILLEHEQQAYDYASQALDLTYQTQSLDILRQVQKLRDRLLVRGETSYTKDLDRHIEKTHAVIANGREFHV